MTDSDDMCFLYIDVCSQKKKIGLRGLLQCLCIKFWYVKSLCRKKNRLKSFEHLVATADDMFMLLSIYIETLENDYFHSSGIPGLS